MTKTMLDASAWNTSSSTSKSLSNRSSCGTSPTTPTRRLIRCRHSERVSWSNMASRQPNGTSFAPTPRTANSPAAASRHRLRETLWQQRPGTNRRRASVPTHDHWRDERRHLFHTASIGTDWLGGLGQRGTVPGEFIRSIAQFGQWPLGAWHNMVGPLLGNKPLIDKAGYMAALLLAATTSGMLGLQSKQILAGKSPLPMNDERTWLAPPRNPTSLRIGATW